MSKEAAKRLIFEMFTNKELRAKTAGITDKEELVKKAVEAGYDVTLDDILEADKEMKAEIAAKNDELSADELESAAGGEFFLCDTARDGHEFSCLVSYHHDDYQKEEHDWCDKSYNCNINNRGGFKLDPRTIYIPPYGD